MLLMYSQVMSRPELNRRYLILKFKMSSGKQLDEIQFPHLSSFPSDASVVQTTATKYSLVRGSRLVVVVSVGTHGLYTNISLLSHGTCSGFIQQQKNYLCYKIMKFPRIQCFVSCAWRILDSMVHLLFFSRSEDLVEKGHILNQPLKTKRPKLSENIANFFMMFSAFFRGSEKQK